MLSTLPRFASPRAASLRTTFFRTALWTASFAAAAAALTGCAGFTTTAAAPGIAGQSLGGLVHGGQQPVAGSHIYLFEVGATGYGSASTNIVTAAGSSGSDIYGNYVTSDQSGNWSLNGYTCVASTDQTYVLAVGGNPGLQPSTVNNSAITLLAATGQCGNLVNVAKVFVSELSTAALITTAQQFFVDVNHLGSSSTNTAGLATALTTVADLADLGTSASRTANLSGTGVSPQNKLNTLGDILAPCVNSAGPNSSACTTLFAAVTPSGGTTPSTVAGAMLLIASNPTNNVSNIYSISSATAPFQPELASAPNDFALAITYTGGGLTAPTNVAVDASGNAWVTNCVSCLTNPTPTGSDAIIGISPTGVFQSGTAGYTTGIHKPYGLAFDASGSLWSTDQASGQSPAQVVKMSGAAVTFAFSSSQISTPVGIAIDPSGNAWVSNQTVAGTAVKVSGTAPGSVLATATDTTVQFSFPTGIGIDSTGAVYEAETAAGNIFKFDTTGTAIYSSSNGVTQPLGLTVDGNNNVLSINNDSSLLSKLYGSSGNPEFDAPVSISNAYQVSVDGANTYWIADCFGNCPNASGNGNLLHVSNAGTLIGGGYGLQDPALFTPTSSAIDATGNVWMTNSRGGSITEYLGVAAPARTPLSVATFASQLGVRP